MPLAWPLVEADKEPWLLYSYAISEHEVLQFKFKNLATNKYFELSQLGNFHRVSSENELVYFLELLNIVVEIFPAYQF